MQPRLDRRCKKAASEDKPLYPDELDVLREACRKIDEEKDGGRAWQMVCDISMTGIGSQNPEWKRMHSLVADNIHSCTAAYLTLNVQPPEAATGVFVGISHRVFLATTSHSIPQRPNGKLSFVGMRLKNLDDHVPAIADFGKDTDESLRDVAYLEIDPAFVTKLGKAPLPLSRIYPCRAGQQKTWTIVGGYPSEIIQNKQTGATRLDLQFNFQSWSNRVLIPGDWSVLPKVRPARGYRTVPDKTLDVFVAYPRNDEVDSCGTSSIEQLPEPFGMSGGGYWQPKRTKKSRIWSPDSYCLIAIQSKWWGLGRYLQATQIVHWLRLLWDRRPDVRADLEDAFPKVRWTLPGRPRLR